MRMVGWVRKDFVIEVHTPKPRICWVLLLERQAESSLADLCAAMVANARDDALFALAALHWYQSHACQPLAMHVSMPC